MVVLDVQSVVFEFDYCWIDDDCLLIMMRELMLKRGLSRWILLPGRILWILMAVMILSLVLS